MENVKNLHSYGVYSLMGVRGLRHMEMYTLNAESHFQSPGCSQAMTLWRSLGTDHRGKGFEVVLEDVWTLD